MVKLHLYSVHCGDYEFMGLLIPNKMHLRSATQFINNWKKKHLLHNDAFTKYVIKLVDDENVIHKEIMVGSWEAFNKLLKEE